MGTRLLTVLAVLFVGGLLASCAGGTETPRPGESGSSVSPSSSSSPSASPSPSGVPSGPPSASAADLTLSGQVEAGVEAKCLILRAGGKVYQLMGGDQNVIKAGNNVTVRGHVVTGVMSYCMQGEPFQVTEAKLS
jgi:hypothetical protein